MNGVIYDKISGRLPIKHWLPFEEIEPGALSQAINLSGLPFVFRNVALMPDCHQGYGMPIGGVIATTGAVIPYAIGVDIGCGISFARTSLKADNYSPEDYAGVKSTILNNIPVGYKHRGTPVYNVEMPSIGELNGKIWSDGVIKKLYNEAVLQAGTLGGGNHFIELQKDKDGYLCVMIHSGSRNLGYRVAKHYNEIAVKLNAKYYSVVDPKQQLAFLPEGTDEFEAYLHEMNYCVEFAKINRQIMMSQVCMYMSSELDVAFDTSPILDVAHNYARRESHFGKNVWVHRKGATSAREGELGIIPGSQGAFSCIVKGLGNKDSFCSCSHGAGRKMSRTAAVHDLDLEEQIQIMDKQKIVHGIRKQGDLDEAPGAYKDMEAVMHNQKDLVEIINRLSPLMVVKAGKGE